MKKNESIELKKKITLTKDTPLFGEYSFAPT